MPALAGLFSFGTAFFFWPFAIPGGLCFPVAGYSWYARQLISIIKSWGVARVEFVRTHEQSFIPTPLKLPFVLGTIGMVFGEKWGGWYGKDACK